MPRPRNGSQRETSADIAFITPRVVKWALDQSAISRQSVAAKLGVTEDQIRAWETDPNSPPPFAKARSLAKLLHLPFGYFFLPEPPQDSPPLPDLRSLDPSYRPSQEFLQLLNDVLVRQDWYRDYLQQAGHASKVKFVGRFDTKARVGDVATDIREVLNISSALRTGISSWAEYLSTLARNAEDAGVLVMRSSVVGNATQRSVSVSELQGFAIADPIAPVVFINSADFKAAQVFTFAHEIAHIWLGQSAIANPDPTALGKGRLEAFCNQVAVAVLVPESEFRSMWDALDTDSRVQALARRFWVSTLVILRRAHELDLVSNRDFIELVRNEREKMTKRSKPSGGDFYRNVVVRMSARLTYTVLGEVNRNAIPLRDGARLLGLSVPTLAKFAAAER